MDDKSNELLEDILNQQREQTDLLRKNLWRIRFSLRALLLLMTLVAVGLGYVANTIHTQNTNARRAKVNVVAPIQPMILQPKPINLIFPAPAPTQPSDFYQTPPSKVDIDPVG